MSTFQKNNNFTSSYIKNYQINYSGKLQEKNIKNKVSSSRTEKKTFSLIDFSV